MMMMIRWKWKKKKISFISQAIIGVTGRVVFVRCTVGIFIASNNIIYYYYIYIVAIKDHSIALACLLSKRSQNLYSNKTKGG